MYSHKDRFKVNKDRSKLGRNRCVLATFFYISEFMALSILILLLYDFYKSENPILLYHAPILDKLKDEINEDIIDQIYNN